MPHWKIERTDLLSSKKSYPEYTSESALCSLNSESLSHPHIQTNAKHHKYDIGFVSTDCCEAGH